MYFIVATHFTKKQKQEVLKKERQNLKWEMYSTKRFNINSRLQCMTRQENDKNKRKKFKKKNESIEKCCYEYNENTMVLALKIIILNAFLQ